MTFKAENLIEITWIVKEYAMNGNLLCIPYTQLKEIINTLSDKFETLHCNTDWNELDYSEEIINFTNKEIALELWHRFGDVSMDLDTEKIKEDWNGFRSGTFREDIWRWFEGTFGVSVAEDLMGQETLKNREFIQNPKKEVTRKQYYASGMTLVKGKWQSCGWTIEADSFVEAAQIAESDGKFRLHSLSDNVMY